jgi:glucose-specific phosphotransferase system IIA component
MADVPDLAFSEGAMGEGVAIVPAEGVVRAPVAGQVVVLFPTGHAVALQSPEGVEVLIHVGIDSAGAPGVFTPVVAQGDEVQAGDLLVRFDLEKLRRTARSVVAPVVITGLPEGLKLEFPPTGETVTAGVGSLLHVVR